ncbi:MAG: patatin-like phospholipase family protein [Nannocystaceae bacterium]
MSRDLGLTLAGGGNRTLYSLALIERWWERLAPRLAAAAGVSAGACMICLHVAGRAREAREFWHVRRREVVRNLDPARLLRGKSIAAHGDVYRDTLLYGLGGAGIDRVRAAPFPILILAAAPPKPVPAGLGTAIGFSAYNLEKKLRGEMVHPTFGRRLGFRPVVVDARACESAEALTELILASSATPPFTPIGRYGGEALIDGGVIDNVPAFVAESVPAVARNLVLLSRPYPPAVLGRKGPRLYLAPTRPTPVECWDYTRSDLADATHAMGEREASIHEPALGRFLGDR